MILVRTRRELRDRVREARARGGIIGLVPTMGYLHEGHLTLLDAARERASWVAVSVFVNPLQFGPGEDLHRYPRDLERDRRLLAERGAALCFAPTQEEMYPEGRPLVTVDAGPMAEGLCGRYRPGHFRGVLTVVARLFGLVRPDLAVFGQKDFQQGVLIRRMVRDLELGVRIELVPVVREEDGLARSSRNALLTPEERAEAPALHRSLSDARRRFEAGERDPGALVRAVREEVERHDHLEVQYVELVDPETLEPLSEARAGGVLAMAAFAGSTRLIDNVRLGRP